MYKCTKINFIVFLMINLYLYNIELYNVVKDTLKIHLNQIFKHQSLNNLYTYPFVNLFCFIFDTYTLFNTFLSLITPNNI